MFYEIARAVSLMLGVNCILFRLRENRANKFQFVAYSVMGILLIGLCLIGGVGFIIQKCDCC